MQFRIADTFTESLTRLTSEEQKIVKTTAFDLQMNPKHPGMKFHKLDRAKDKSFWSIRVNNEIRLIVHKSDQSLMLCYVDHHDAAYRWGERRKLEVHPRTGAAQLIEVQEMVREVVISRYVEDKDKKPAVFDGVSDDVLLDCGVPPEWLDEVRLANEDTLLELVDHLPSESAEALINLAVGESPQVVITDKTNIDPFDHPDALRRFRVMLNMEDLKLALEYPWEKWMVFLHPEQRKLVERDYNGPVRISGSAGTGKTIVALHRAVFLARNHPDSRILLTTYSDTLANALKRKLEKLVSNEPRVRERLEVYSITAIGKRLYERNFGSIRFPSQDFLLQTIRRTDINTKEFNPNIQFLLREWEDIVDAWQLNTWEAYRDVKRLGRKRRLPEKQREITWAIFEQLRSQLNANNLITQSKMYHCLASLFTDNGHSPFDFVVVDESQDLNVPQLKFLASIGSRRSDGLFFTGDLGQRIFQQPFSWRRLGIDIRGRSSSLRINYRTSHQIRMQADKLMPEEIADVDGNSEKRKGTISVFNGPEPIVKVSDSIESEIEFIGRWIKTLAMEKGIPIQEIGVFVRTSEQVSRAKKAVEKSGLTWVILDEHLETENNRITISTMHLTKGLEFRAVVIMACDDEVIPLQSRIETVTDESDLDEVYHTERNLLYVACTRARDYLLLSGVNPVSEFLEDMYV